MGDGSETRPEGGAATAPTEPASPQRKQRPTGSGLAEAIAEVAKGTPKRRTPEEMRRLLLKELEAGGVPTAPTSMAAQPTGTVVVMHEAAPMRRRTAIDRGELGRAIGELLLETIETEVALVRQARDPSWMRLQSAGELGSLYATFHDRMVETVRAAERGAARTAAATATRTGTDGLTMDPDAPVMVNTRE